MFLFIDDSLLLFSDFYFYFYFDLLLKLTLDLRIENTVDVLFIFVQFVENDDPVVVNYFDLYTTN